MTTIRLRRSCNAAVVLTSLSLQGVDRSFVIAAEVQPTLDLSAETSWWSSVLAHGEEGNW